MPCKHEFGCHSCKATLMELHAAIKHELALSWIDHDRVRKGLVSVKRFIEDIVGVEE